jgi:hypothetical protein
MCLSPEEIREWVKFVAILVGASIALRTYVVSQRQRRLENSLKLIEIFEGNLQENDIAEWKRIFMNSSEPSGAKPGHFYSEERYQLPFDSLFSEGPDDNGAIERIVEQIDLISYEILNRSIDERVVYSRIGQLMNTTYSWFGKGDRSLIKSRYPHFHKVMKKFGPKFRAWPTKTYTHCE